MTRRPPPLRSDETNAFARYSMRTRVPRIARDTAERNPAWPAAARAGVLALAAQIEEEGPLPPPRPPEPDFAAWASAWEEHRRETWLHAEWFFAELYFYRELAHACRFWETGQDPFLPFKEEELAGERPWERLRATLEARGTTEERLAIALDQALWGNRVDLSYAVAAHAARRDDDLLVDERAAAVAILARPGGTVEVLADNAGTELALDLGLVDAILAAGARAVTLHVKLQPVFVSDATPADVWRTLAAMAGRGGDLRALGARLTEAFDHGRLRVVPDPFWSGPRFLWQMPPHIEAPLSAASLVISKGDANYRRVVGDALWPPSAPFAEACDYLRAPLVCLRTMKSDAVLGLPSGAAERLDAADGEWRINGRRGLVQTYSPR